MMAEAIAIREKQARRAGTKKVEEWVFEQLGEAYAERHKEVAAAFDEVKRRPLYVIAEETVTAKDAAAAPAPARPAQAGGDA